MLARGLFFPFILISAIGFTIYANVINGKFIWDDNALVKDNLYLKNWKGIPKILTNDIGVGSEREYGYYRPLQLFSYMLEYACGGLNPRVYHITNIVLHLVVAFSILWLVIILYGNRLLALLSGLIFLSHPLQTETVAYISNRGDLLSALFLLAAFIFYIKGLESKDTVMYLLMMINYVLALLSKENALIFMGILLLYHYVFEPSRSFSYCFFPRAHVFKEKLSKRYFFSILAVSIAYIIFRIIIIKSTISTISLKTLFERVPGFFVAFANYLRLLFFPYGLHFVYGNKVFRFREPEVLLGILLASLIITYGLSMRKKDKVIFFSIFWFFVTLIPVSSIYPVTTFYMAEHYLYIPLVGFAIILARCILWLYATQALKALAIFMIMAIVILYGYLTVKQNNHWREPIDFYLRELSFSPDNPGVYSNLADEYDKINDRITAIFLYKKAIELNPSQENAYNNLGVLYTKLNHKQEALMLFKKAIELNPAFVKAYNNLGVIYSKLNHKKEAWMLFKKAIELNPRFAEAYNNLGILYYEFNKKDESIFYFKKTLEVNPNYSEAWYNLAVAYYYDKQYDLAARYCNQAVKLGYTASPNFLKQLQAVPPGH